ncbi:hypothetical protein HXX76_001279 [Chlamydomonas incerta]|uniref:SET domain-containing protein n=1 Tax=Chlamydomonas incerta TaxID=51695 RepID=A0A836B1F1_CHLIN|nr:hypothetical protein HXX76_001279 [Chlamydomonas incerta]|eukprot:KAG2444533.1 hypothetical protein HXX76_001279 [Chlamydomonas incerta]
MAPPALAPSTSSTAAAPPPALSRRDPRLLAAMAGALTLVGEASYSQLSLLQPEQLPALSAVAPALAGGAAAAAGAVAAGLGLAKLVMGDRFHVELLRGRLYIVAGVPSTGPAVAPGAVVVRPTGDVRGNGAYAAAPIPAGTCLGAYTGELLDTAAFDAKYPHGAGDYAMAVDEDHVLDAAHLAPATAAFHPVHMNHSAARPNVGRYYRRATRTVLFFTLRHVAPGEELLYDYGRRYWRGREHLELP